jgi:hypothetical protein
MQSTAVVAARQEKVHRIVLLGTPLTLALLELGHPLLDRMNPLGMLAPIVTWWTILHLLLVPLFALRGWAFFLLLRNIHHHAATVSRYAAVVYTAFAIEYDAVVGLNAGLLMTAAKSLPAVQQHVILQVLSQLFSNPAILLSGDILVIAGVLSVFTAARALLYAGIPRLPAFVLLGAMLAAYSHALPFGPLGDACFFLAAFWIELVWRTSTDQKIAVMESASMEA